MMDTLLTELIEILEKYGFRLLLHVTIKLKSISFAMVSSYMSPTSVNWNNYDVAFYNVYVESSPLHPSYSTMRQLLIILTAQVAINPQGPHNYSRWPTKFGQCFDQTVVWHRMRRSGAVLRVAATIYCGKWPLLKNLYVHACPDRFRTISDSMNTNCYCIFEVDWVERTSITQEIHTWLSWSYIGSLKLTSDSSISSYISSCVP